MLLLLGEYVLRDYPENIFPVCNLLWHYFPSKIQCSIFGKNRSPICFFRSRNHIPIDQCMDSAMRRGKIDLQYNMILVFIGIIILPCNGVMAIDNNDGWISCFMVMSD